MNVIRLHDLEGKPVLFNAEFIVLITSALGMGMDGEPITVSVVALSNGAHAQVRESVEEIAALAAGAL
jgi:uncharacterized protein YlzI (FlbEa/FlbD family)